jgi:hypothetical protein
LIALVVAGLFFLSHRKWANLIRFYWLEKLPIRGALFSPAKICLSRFLHSLSISSKYVCNGWFLAAELAGLDKFAVR